MKKKPTANYKNFYLYACQVKKPNHVQEQVILSGEETAKDDVKKCCDTLHCILCLTLPPGKFPYQLQDEHCVMV